MPALPERRYADVVARQLLAIQQDDLAAFGTLAEERDALAHEVGTSPADEAARSALAHAAALDARLLALLRQRRDRLKSQLDKADAGVPGVRAYSLAAGGTQARAIDVSL